VASNFGLEFKAAGKQKGMEGAVGDPADSLMVRGCVPLPGNPALEGVPTL
jgi:hypothetical protein